MFGRRITQRVFVRSGLISLSGLTLFLSLLWYIALPSGLSPSEEMLWQKVRAAQLEIAGWRTKRGMASDVRIDPWRLGLIGREWSPITTTLGDLQAKRTACSPAWAIWLLRVFQDMGLEPGDKLAIYSSGSFPGLILNSMAAAQGMGLKTQLIVSLGASSWGANDMRLPWPVLEAELERRGFIAGKADYYTLGGGDELGRGMSPEAVRLLKQAADMRKVRLLTAPDYAAMVRLKYGMLRDFAPKLLISIGGSRTNLGSDPAVLKLPPGLLRSDSVNNSGNGMIGKALEQGLPVIHLLNLRKLARRVGIPYDREPSPKGPAKPGYPWFAVGLLAYVLVLWFYRRWRINPV